MYGTVVRQSPEMSTYKVSHFGDDRTD